MARSIPRRTYQLEHFWPDGSGWHSCEFMDRTTRKEAEECMQHYKDANPGDKFRLVIVKPPSCEID